MRYKEHDRKSVTRQGRRITARNKEHDNFVDKEQGARRRTRRTTTNKGRTRELGLGYYVILYLVYNIYVPIMRSQ